ncbi:MAG: hypothetical protein HC919_00005 [Oscillatoriales cyanobacterium SM2_2_1]|nr:hypothetical protein [Oscillatoriales cyanobacterium SM2_2_1]
MIQRTHKLAALVLVAFLSPSAIALAQQTTTRTGPNGNSQTTNRSVNGNTQTTTRTGSNGNTQTTNRTVDGNTQTTTRTRN